MNARVRRFLDELDDLGVDATTTSVDAFAVALRDRLERPAVGVPIDVPGCTLADLPVETAPTPADLAAAATGVTPAAIGVAATGSVLLADDGGLTEAVSLYPRRHVVVVPASAIVAGIADGIDRLAAVAETAGTSGVLATGPSATADMGDLVVGAHGPAAVDVLVVADR
ncbi:MAG: LUD domain-containing protein [Halobacteriales archaeon]